MHAHRFVAHMISWFLQILVQGRVGLNRAVDGDIVAVKLLPREEWSVPSDLVLQDEEGDSGRIFRKCWCVREVNCAHGIKEGQLEVN
jgi:hypothetical protein